MLVIHLLEEIQIGLCYTNFHKVKCQRVLEIEEQHGNAAFLENN